MSKTEILVMSIFGFLALCVLVTAIRQGAKHKVQLARYAASHGFTVLESHDARLMAVLEATDSENRWSPSPIMLVEPAPQAVYLFSFTTNPSGRSRGIDGHACLAEHSVGRPEWPVSITTRVPLLDHMMSGRVDAGGDRFRSEFTVTSSNAGAALAAVNSEVERALLEHASGPAWNLNVTIAKTGVLVYSHWAASEQEWDYLIALARKLRAALR